MDLVFGKGGFILSLNNAEILNNRNGSIKDLSDIESDLTEFISDEKNIADESSGEYWNPDLLIKNCTADEWNNKFKNLLGAAVGFAPFSDNTAFSFDCTVLECFPIWQDNKYWKCDVKIKLASVLPVVPAVYFSGSTLMWIGFDITPPVEPNDSLMWVSDTIYPVPTDYIHYYPLTTDFNDNAGSNNIINYGVTIANNKALFNSNTDLLVLGSAITSSAISLVLTIKFSSLSDNVIFNGVSVNYNMLILHNSKLAFYSTGYNDSTFTVELNTEYKLCLIKDGTNVKLYVDGVKYLDNNNGISNATEQFKNLGNVGTGQQLYSAQGEYSQFKIFNRALTGTEAIQLTME